MEKKNYITFIVFLLLATLFFYKFKNYAKTVKDEHCFTTQISSKIFDFNTFELKVDSMLKITDFKLVNQNSGKTIFEDGKSKKGIKNEYGFCNFELFWKAEKVYLFGHFKKNNWHTNSYTLFVEMKDNELAPSLNIVGRDSLKTKIFFRKL